MFDIINALILGFTYGLGPCTISCAPLIVPLIMSTANSRKEGIILSLIFSVGRVISYITLGFLAGLMGRTLDFYLPQKYLGLFFIALGVAVFFISWLILHFVFRGKNVNFTRVAVLALVLLGLGLLGTFPPFFDLFAGN